MSENKESSLISLLNEILENGDFFHSAIESADMKFDFVEWKERVISALKESKART